MSTRRSGMTSGVLGVSAAGAAALLPPPVRLITTTTRAAATAAATPPMTSARFRERGGWTAPVGAVDEFGRSGRRGLRRDGLGQRVGRNGRLRLRLRRGCLDDRWWGRRGWRRRRGRHGVGTDERLEAVGGLSDRVGRRRGRGGREGRPVGGRVARRSHERLEALWRRGGGGGVVGRCRGRGGGAAGWAPRANVANPSSGCPACGGASAGGVTGAAAAAGGGDTAGTVEAASVRADRREASWRRTPRPLRLEERGRRQGLVGCLGGLRSKHPGVAPPSRAEQADHDLLEIVPGLAAPGGAPRGSWPASAPPRLRDRRRCSGRSRGRRRRFADVLQQDRDRRLESWNGDRPTRSS